VTRTCAERRVQGNCIKEVIVELVRWMEMSVNQRASIYLVLFYLALS